MSTLHPTHRALLAGAALAFGLAGPAFAQGAAAPAGEAPRGLAEPAGPPPCTVAALRGSYVFSVRGFTDAASGLPPALLGAFAAAGTTVYDGAGKVTIAARSASFNGVARTLPAETGSYEVGSDCVVSAHYPSGVSTRNVLIDGGRAMFAMQTNPGTTLGGLSQRAARSGDADRGRLRCTPQALAGRYGFHAEGFAGPPTLPLAGAVPLVGNGVVTLQRSGRFEATALRSVGGVLDAQPLPLSGSFTVDADCAVQMNFDVGFDFAGSVADGGREIVFVETDPGTTLLVRARRQD
ncbi:MAG TPA: hypothetical protein PLB41_02025 [Rubrivivax sp.]|mgnify:CR=1 FL=1|nr:hypothetical protein [Rubrivivax sp.]HPO19407.1 hypothetical protein [Rubrivivax sp.]